MAQSKLLIGKSGPQCILTVDDDQAFRLSIKMFLEDFGYLVLEADSGITGREQLSRHHPDLILLDLRLPKLNGLDFLKLIRETNSDIPVIVISGTGIINDVVEALRHGASDFLLKPIGDLLVLKHSIEKALEQARLQRENHEYREHLEEIVSQRTTTLERTYRQLTKSEEKYRSIYENLQDIYFETTLDGKLREISPSAKNLLLFKRDEIHSKSSQVLFDNPEQHEQLLQTLLKKRRVADYEIQLTGRNSQAIYCSINAMLHFDTIGHPSHISGIMRDISERKVAEKEILATNQTLEALFDATPLAILAVDANLKVTLWNRAAVKLFGWRRQDVIGRPYPLAPPNKQAEAQQNLKRAMAGEQFRGLELVRQHCDGHLVTVNLTTAPLYAADGTIYGQILIFEDVSEVQKLRSEAERSSRLASLGELSAGIAHEINNPNGLILLNLPTLKDFVMEAIELLQQQDIAQPDLKLAGLNIQRAAEAFPQLLGEMEDSARRIKQIVDDLKAFSGQESFSQDDFFDLNQSAETAIRLTANHLKNATFHFETALAKGLPQLKGSAQRIEQVIVNLLINACEALTDRDQTIRIETGIEPDTKEIYLCVHDEGCGISSQHLPHITDPFFTTRRENGGTGLGLSVSARIIKEHNARMEFKSKPGQGTCACSYFPFPKEL